MPVVKLTDVAVDSALWVDSIPPKVQLKAREMMSVNIFAMKNHSSCFIYLVKSSDSWVSFMREE